LISSAVLFAFVSVRLTHATRAPSLAKRTAIARPIPRPAPVTIAAWFSNLIWMSADYAEAVVSQAESTDADQTRTGLITEDSQESDFNGERFLNIATKMIA
jgi:hypothetical protein